jgi:hypothetical protein
MSMHYDMCGLPFPRDIHQGGFGTIPREVEQAFEVYDLNAIFCALRLKQKCMDEDLPSPYKYSKMTREGLLNIWLEICELNDFTCDINYHLGRLGADLDWFKCSNMNNEQNPLKNEPIEFWKNY